MSVSVEVGEGVSVDVGDGVSVSVGVNVRVKVGVIVGVSLGVGVGVNVTAGRPIGPVGLSPSNSRKIQPPSYWRSVGSVCPGATRSHVSSSLCALKARHFPTSNGSPRGA